LQKSSVLHRSLLSDYPVATDGDGVYLIDSSGNTYLDACGGAAVSCLGHSDQALRDAIAAQLNRLAYAHSGFFTTEPMEELAHDLIEHAPDDFSHVYFVSGGSEAVESALKLARQYFTEIGQSNRQVVISRRQSFHGNTLGALAAGGNFWRREPFDPMLVTGYHISPCYAYRNRREDETLEEYGLRAANELESAIQLIGPGKVMAFIAEPVVGATSGAVEAVPGYFRRIREICDHYGVLLILDEVMCGMGRTGTLHACEQEGIQGDLQTVAKGLSGGYVPMGAVFVKREIVDVLERGSGMFQHGHTFIGHALACAAALETQKQIRQRNLLENVRIQGAYLKEQLRQRLEHSPFVGDIRGRGLFVAVELVADRNTKEPFAPELKLSQDIKRLSMEQGLMSYPMSGTVDGKVGDHILLAPPYIVEKAHVDSIVDILGNVIETATRKEKAA
jgi:adenosylmethionine-8-amino-7-oxononanoate aminotransferase